ncbi:MAG: hypothetical protein EKK57_11385 [Proteobacteria bacterium]|nr:MAG: hypothetical protein EKK57_11385 [Pseudomonadota bacterium]
MNKYVKFTGKFTDLIPNGWKFQKLFARNYRQYHKTCDGQKYSQDCRIWQHLGGYLEICDLFSNSWQIVELIANNEIDNYKVSHKVIPRFCEAFDSYSFMIDKINNKFEKRDFIRHVKPKYDITNLPEEEQKAAYDNYSNQWKEFNLDPKMIVLIKDLLDRGWIRVENDNRKK